MARKPVPSVDMALITKEKAAEIKATARRKVEAKKIEAAEAALLAQEIEAAERENDPVYEMRDLLIDLAPHAPYVMIDGQRYNHGESYRVSTPVYATLVEIVARSWEHEAEIGGANRRAYVPPQRNQMISQRTGVLARGMF